MMRTVILVAAATTLLSALTGWFAASLTERPYTVASLENIQRLQAENDILRTRYEELENEIERLASPSAHPPQAGPGPDDDEVLIYQNREFELVGAKSPDHVAFLDLDTGVDDVLLHPEWVDTLQSGDRGGNLAILSEDNNLEWSGFGAWSSSFGAPTTPAACEAEAVSGGQGGVKIDDLVPGDVICLITAEGAVARVEIESAVSSADSPPRVTLNASLWQ